MTTSVTTEAKTNLTRLDGTALATAAAPLVGCRFRLHGRDPATGLDCIGVLAAALSAIGQEVRFPSGYRLRTDRFEQLANIAANHGFEPVFGAKLPGDVLFTRPGPGQLHLLIAAARAEDFIEAHAGLGRVVLTAGLPPDPILHHWRLRAGK